MGNQSAGVSEIFNEIMISNLHVEVDTQPESYVSIVEISYGL